MEMVSCDNWDVYFSNANVCTIYCIQVLQQSNSSPSPSLSQNENTNQRGGCGVSPGYRFNIDNLDCEIRVRNMAVDH